MSKTPASKVAELYGLPIFQVVDWPTIVAGQQCPFLNRKCLKNRKSASEITIGTCTMLHGRKPAALMICPFRLLERSQPFQDCTHLLKHHEPGNELRIVTELSVPGGSIDYCLASVRAGKTKDFVGIELQTLDTTGTVWPERQRFLRSHKIPVKRKDADSDKTFGINWKMTAKTILMQLHHKVTAFEGLCKHLVLVLQDCLLAYMRREFSFGHIQGVRDGDSMHFHSYLLQREPTGYRLDLAERLSTDANGIAMCLGRQPTEKVVLEAVLQQIDDKLPQSTLLTVGGAIPVPESVDLAADEDGDSES